MGVEAPRQLMAKCMDVRLHVEADASAIGFAYPVQNCAAVTVKTDA